MRTDTVTQRGAAKEKILNTASSLFYNQGIRATGIDTIVAEAGITKMTLYKYFKSKDELVLAVLQSRENSWRNWLEKEIELRAKSPKGQILAVFDLLEEWFGSKDFRGSPFHNAIVELADPSHPAHKAAVAHRQKNKEFMRQLVKEAGLRHVDQLTEQIMVLFAGAVMAAVLDNSPLPASAAKEATAILIKQAERDLKPRK